LSSLLVYVLVALTPTMRPILRFIPFPVLYGLLIVALFQSFGGTQVILHVEKHINNILMAIIRGIFNVFFFFCTKISRSRNFVFFRILFLFEKSS